MSKSSSVGRGELEPEQSKFKLQRKSIGIEDKLRACPSAVFAIYMYHNDVDSVFQEQAWTFNEL